MLTTSTSAFSLSPTLCTSQNFRAGKNLREKKNSEKRVAPEKRVK